MFQVRIHGRGGQGVVTAAELLSMTAFTEGLHAQAFPSFGSERMGAPVAAFCRISNTPIRTREPIADPDGVIVQDPTLIHLFDLFGGLSKEGFVLVNSSRTPESLGLSAILEKLPTGHVRTIPATEIAREKIGRPIPNIAMLGGFAAMTGIITLKALAWAIHTKFPKALAEKNIEAAQAAFAAVQHAIAGEPIAARGEELMV